MAKKAPVGASWTPPSYEKPDVGAIQALINGVAEPHQQQRAMKYIIETLCGTYDMSFRPGGDRETTFAEGRRFVGLQLVKLTKLDISKLQQK